MHIIIFLGFNFDVSVKSMIAAKFIVLKISSDTVFIAYTPAELYMYPRRDFNILFPLFH